MKISIIYSSNLQSYILFSELLKKYPFLIEGLYQVPNFPTNNLNKIKNYKFFKKILSSSMYFIVLNLFTIELYGFLSFLCGNRLKDLCKKLHIKHKKYSCISQEMIEKLKKSDPNYIFHCSPFILKENFLDIKKKGVLNYHGAPLPEYRGAANYIWILLDQVEEAYGTLHFVDKGLDTGDIIAFSSSFSIPARSSAFYIWQKIRIEGAKLILSIAKENFEKGVPLKGYVQDAEKAYLRSFPLPHDTKKLRQKKHPIFTLKDIAFLFKIAIFGDINKILNLKK